MHSRGAARADVTEGNKSAWERLGYDWTDPRRVVMRTVDSNLKGRIVGVLLGSVGKGVLAKAPAGTVTQIEARSRVA